MADSLLLLALLVAAYVGFALLALSQAQHWRRAELRQPAVGHGHQPCRAGRGLHRCLATSVVASLRAGLVY